MDLRILGRHFCGKDETCGPLDTAFRINLHFHPDLPCKGSSVIESLVVDRQYHSQFTTKVSNGRLAVSEDDPRVRWEEDLFSGYYGQPGCQVERPKYGSLNVFADSYGSSPRFGSCFFILKQHMLERATFCFPESCLGPRAFATAKHFGLLDLARATVMDDRLDWYIEVHVHGPVTIPDDIEALVLDPSFQSTKIEHAANRLGCEIRWHQGYRAHTDVLRLHEGYRGAAIVDVASQIANQDGILTPSLLTSERIAQEYSPQDLKRVWHYIARFGRQTPWPDAVLSQSS